MKFNYPKNPTFHKLVEGRLFVYVDDKHSDKKVSVAQGEATKYIKKHCTGKVTCYGYDGHNDALKMYVFKYILDGKLK